MSGSKTSAGHPASDVEEEDNVITPEQLSELRELLARQPASSTVRSLPDCSTLPDLSAQNYTPMLTSLSSESVSRLYDIFAVCDTIPAGLVAGVAAEAGCSDTLALRFISRLKNTLRGFVRSNIHDRNESKAVAVQSTEWLQGASHAEYVAQRVGEMAQFLDALGGLRNGDEPSRAFIDMMAGERSFEVQDAMLEAILNTVSSEAVQFLVVAGLHIVLQSLLDTAEAEEQFSTMRLCIQVLHKTNVGVDKHDNSLLRTLLRLSKFHKESISWAATSALQAWPGLAKDFLITEGARMSVPVRGRGRPPKNARAQDGLIPPIPSVPLKRGPGRPPKTAKMAENIARSPIPVKRGRGRPRKPVLAAEDVTGSSTPANRGRGRPPNPVRNTEDIAGSPTPAKRGRGRPPKPKPAEDIVESPLPVKRGRGRPPTGDIAASPTPAKRGRGRPPNSARMAANLARSPTPVKRGRGRPPKTARLEEDMATASNAGKSVKPSQPIERANGYRGRGEGSGLGDARGGVLHEKLDAERRMFPKTESALDADARDRVFQAYAREGGVVNHRRSWHESPVWPDSQEDIQPYGRRDYSGRGSSWTSWSPYDGMDSEAWRAAVPQHPSWYEYGGATAGPRWSRQQAGSSAHPPYAERAPSPEVEWQPPPAMELPGPDGVPGVRGPHSESWGQSRREERAREARYQFSQEIPPYPAEYADTAYLEHMSQFSRAGRPMNDAGLVPPIPFWPEDQVERIQQARQIAETGVEDPGLIGFPSLHNPRSALDHRLSHLPPSYNYAWHR